MDKFFRFYLMNKNVQSRNMLANKVSKISKVTYSFFALCSMFTMYSSCSDKSKEGEVNFDQEGTTAILKDSDFDQNADIPNSLLTNDAQEKLSDKLQAGWEVERDDLHRFQMGKSKLQITLRPLPGSPKADKNRVNDNAMNEEIPQDNFHFETANDGERDRADRVIANRVIAENGVSFIQQSQKTSWVFEILSS